MIVERSPWLCNSAILFYYNEYNDHLDLVNEKHLYALHYVFLPRINKAIEDFKNASNHQCPNRKRDDKPVVHHRHATAKEL